MSKLTLRSFFASLGVSVREPYSHTQQTQNSPATGRLCAYSGKQINDGDETVQDSAGRWYLITEISKSKKPK